MTRLNEKFLPKESLIKLNLHKIYTVQDFLQSDSDKLAHFTSLDFEEIILIRQQLIAEYSAKVETSILKKMKQTMLKTGIKSLDDLLQGGLMTNTLIEICGLSGSGKTQLALNIFANLSLDNIEAIYIDTKGDFSATHFASLFENRVDDKKLEEILDNLQVLKISNMNDLISVLHNLKFYYSTHKKNERKLIIVDSISVLYLPFLGQLNEGLSLLNHVASLAKLLSGEFNATFLFVNLAGKNFEDVDIVKENDELKPFLGKYWYHVPNTRLIVTRPDLNRNLRNVQVRKSNMIKIGGVCSFKLDETGLIKD